MPELARGNLLLFAMAWHWVSERVCPSQSIPCVRAARDSPYAVQLPAEDSRVWQSGWRRSLSAWG